MTTPPAAGPSQFITSIKARRGVAEGTMAFDLERPAGFQFRAGQFVDVTLIDPPETDAEGNIRAFSIASAPCQADRLTIATRMRDTAFKRFLKTAPLGTAIQIEGPSGSFTLHNNPNKPAVFLIGGIGITPVISIIRQATHDHRPNHLYLFYSNRHPGAAAFIDELNQLAAANPNFHFIPSMSEATGSGAAWAGEAGFIDEAMVRRHLPDMKGPIYYMAGPPGMVAAMRNLLVGAAVDEDDIRTEEFSGY